MSTTPYMQLYVGDYLSDTLHLTTEQHGAYLLLLITMWKADARLPNDAAKLARIARCTPKKWLSIWPEISDFFLVDGEWIFNERLSKEHKKVEGLSEKRRAAGSVGGTAKSLKTKESALASASDLFKHSHISYTDIDKEVRKKETRENALASPFDAFWIEYPNKVGKDAARKAFALAAKRAPQAEIMDGLRRYVGKTDDRPWCNPATFLNQGRWADQPATVAPQQRSHAPPERRTASHAFMELAREQQKQESEYDKIFEFDASLRTPRLISG